MTEHSHHEFSCAAEEPGQECDCLYGEIVRLRAELRGIGELQCSCAEVAALREALEAAHRFVPRHEMGGNSVWPSALHQAHVAALASSAEAAEAHDTRLRDIEHSETREVCMSVIEGRTGYEPMASALAERDAEVRQAALEEATVVAKSYGPSRPIYPASNAGNPNIRGRWEGEQAASGAIASLILALKESK